MTPSVGDAQGRFPSLPVPPHAGRREREFANMTAPQRKASGFRRIDRALAKVTKPFFRSRGFALADLLAHWPAIVGPELADSTCPERLGANGQLRIHVAGPAATEIQHLEPQILERIAVYFGYRAVRRLVLLQGPLPPTRPADPALRPTREAEARPCEGLERIAPSELRSALERLGRAVRARPSAQDVPREAIDSAEKKHASALERAESDPYN